VQVGKHDLDCQHVRTVEAMNAERALAYSCNSYFTEMGARLTNTELADALRRAGFGAPTHLVKNESTGYVHMAAGGDQTELAAVGESGVVVTPLQVAAAYRLLAMQAHASDSSVKTVLAGLSGAVTYGTAQGAGADGIEVAGKTGTSTAMEGAWTHAWFAGFAPAEDPKIVAVIFLERGHGSEAAEIAGLLFQQWAKGAR
jgi:penicillin-binding protein 2